MIGIFLILQKELPQTKEGFPRCWKLNEMSSKCSIESHIESYHDDYHYDGKVLYLIVRNRYDFEKYSHTFFELLDIIQKLDNDEANQHSCEVGIQAQVVAYLVYLWVLTSIDDISC